MVSVLFPDSGNGFSLFPDSGNGFQNAKKRVQLILRKIRSFRIVFEWNSNRLCCEIEHICLNIDINYNYARARVSMLFSTAHANHLAGSQPRRWIRKTPHRPTSNLRASWCMGRKLVAQAGLQWEHRKMRRRTRFYKYIRICVLLMCLDYAWLYQLHDACLRSVFAVITSTTCYKARTS